MQTEKARLHDLQLFETIKSEQDLKKEAAEDTFRTQQGIEAKREAIRKQRKALADPRQWEMQVSLCVVY
jgi:hypothetical protein